MTKTQDKVIGIYHKDCIDGTMAAAILLRKFPDVELFSLKHGYSNDDFQKIVDSVEEGVIIYIVDFSLPLPNIEKLHAKQPHKIITIDHHIGVKEELEKIDRNNLDFTYIFDNKKSGASLTWSYLFEEKIPEIVRLVERGDLNLDMQEEIVQHSGFLLIPLMNKPEKMMQVLEIPIDEILRKGGEVGDFAEYLMGHYLEKAEPITVLVDGNPIISYNVSFNIERLRSTIGARLVKKHNETILLYRIVGHAVNYSFRSNDELNPSALSLAESLGGGGHRNASGARVTLKKFTEMIVFEK